jgi:Dolichyl-phosphate-mannose-protein mannosyltransferase
MRARVREWAPRGRDEKIAVYGLALLLLAGAAMRALFMVAWRPAFMGYPDSLSYVYAARWELFGDPFRTAGYPLFLRVLHDVSPNLSVAIVVQHLLGLLTATLLYLAVRRAGGPAWLGLVPAALVTLGGGQLFLEHAALSEALYGLTAAGALYAAARSIDAAAPVWPAVAGVLAAFSATVRVVSVVLVPVLVLWLLLAHPAPRRRRSVHAGVALASAALVMGGYVLAQEQATGYTGLPRAGVWNTYGRVAPFADCSKFTPPAGTSGLCETRPPSERPEAQAYIFNPVESPAIRSFSSPFFASDEGHRRVAAFTRAVILHQPLDYAEAVGEGMTAYVAPENRQLRLGDSYERFFHHLLFSPETMEDARRWALPYYGADARGYAINEGLVDSLKDYESVTRVQGPLFVILALLSLAGPFAATGRVRSAAILFALVAWALLVAPVAGHWFSARYAVPALGPLAASAAVGGWAFVAAIRRRRVGM